KTLGGVGIRHSFAAAGVRPTVGHEAVPACLGDRFKTRVHAELEQEAAHACPNRHWADVQPSSHRLGRLALDHSSKDLELPRGEPFATTITLRPILSGLLQPGEDPSGGFGGDHDLA